MSGKTSMYSLCAVWYIWNNGKKPWGPDADGVVERRNHNVTTKPECRPESLGVPDLPSKTQTEAVGVGHGQAEMASNKSGNGNDKDLDMTPPTRGRKITADDLAHAAEAAQKAAAAASTAAEAVVVALESGDIDEDMVGGEATREPNPSHAAFEEFMAELQGVIKKAGNSVSVTEHSRWVKIEGVKNGHKVYVAKGKNQVSRIESTLPPNLVPGAVKPDRQNGRIASYIPADTRAVGAAIRQLAQLQERIPAPRTGGGGGHPAGGGGGGGRRPQVEFN